MVESAPLGEDAVRSTNDDDKEPSVTCPKCGEGGFEPTQGLAIHRAKKHRDEPWQDRKTLQGLYHGEGLSTGEIGERLGCNQTTVVNWIHKLNIKMRPQWGQGDTPWQDEEALRREYVHNERSSYELAQEWGCHKKTVLNWLERFGIERRPATHDIDRGWRDADRMERLYLGYEMSVEDIADYLDTDGPTIVRWLHRHDIETRPQKAPSGEDSNFWRGGVSERYWPGDDWWGQKHAALKRDQYRCQGCGADHRDIGRNPDVHHITPIRMIDGGENPNELSNLITLCRACHKRAENMAPLLPDGINR